MQKNKRNWGGRRQHSGRKPKPDNERLRRHQVMLGLTHVEQATRLGKGNLSAGIREAIERSDMAKSPV